MANRRPITLLPRSLYLVDYQCERLGLSRARLFKEVENEFVRLGQERHLPKPSSLDAYLRGRRPIPFDPRIEGAPTWLDVCEWRFGEAYEAYFHSFFALVFGPLSSSEHWRRRDRFNPREWIEFARRHGDRAWADELLRQNARVPARARDVDQRMDRLADIHASFLRLPEEARRVLMVREGLSATWRRAWRSPNEDVASAEATEGLDTLALLTGLVMEAAFVGDHARYRICSDALRATRTSALSLPRFKRVGQWLLRAIDVKVLALDVARYSGVEACAFGYAGRPAMLRYAGVLTGIADDALKH